MNAQLNERVRRFLDGELDAAEAGEVLHAVADDPEARELLRLEYLLNSLFGRVAEDVAVPAGFSDRVMQALQPAAAPVPSPARRLLEGLREAWGLLVAPRPLALRPVYAVVTGLLILVGVGLFAPRTGGEQTVPAAVPLARASAPADGAVLMRFLLVDDTASTVAVAGDFTDWEPVALTAQQVEGQTVWSGVVPVVRGEHRYMFVVDDEEWVTDPLATVQRDDGFGNRNAILIL